jgi:hypothetical protein
MAGSCTGKSKNSCCWVNGKLCPYVRDDGENTERRWVCTLREKYGNWEEVHIDEGYIENVKPHWEATNVPDCGAYPRKDQECGECGLIGE